MKSAGFFNPVHPWTIQVLGEAGAAHLSSLTPKERAALPKKLARAGMKTLIVAGGVQLSDLTPWHRARIDVLLRDDPAHEIVFELRSEQAVSSVQRATVHGVLMQVHGIGVLIEGAAGAGKSVLALDLISRGHALVADDAVELSRTGPGVVIGQGPGVLEGYLASRDLGIVDVMRMHGSRSVRRQARVDLVIGLGARKASAQQLLQGRRSTRRLLGEPVPALSLPSKSGHNLAALVEAAALDRRLRLDGIEADAALIRRQARAIRKKK